MFAEATSRRKIVAFGKQLYEKGLVSATDGNISTKLADDRLLITPTGKALGRLSTKEIVCVDVKGNVQKKQGNPSTELPMHLTIYRQRADVSAVIHAHPPLATAFSVAGEPLEQPVLPEIVLAFGRIPIAPYATPSTIESERAVEELVRNHDLIVLDHHGAVALGRSLEEAFQRLEKLEHLAKTLIAAKQLGRIVPLSEEAIEKLDRMRRGGD